MCLFRVVLNGGKSKWFVLERGGGRAWSRMPLSPILFNIYLMGIAEELEGAQLGGKLDGCWSGTLMYAGNVVLVADSRGRGCKLYWIW